MLFKKTYKLATMLAVMGALTGHAASDIDLNSIGYFFVYSITSGITSAEGYIAII